jgi:hypothetical protein
MGEPRFSLGRERGHAKVPEREYIPLLKESGNQSPPAMGAKRLECPESLNPTETHTLIAHFSLFSLFHHRKALQIEFFSAS